MTRTGDWNSYGALRITGEITDDVRYPWAGAFYLAEPSMRKETNLSRWDGLAFPARRSGGTHRLILFAESPGPARR